jgi:putative hydrolase of HD superfamily
VVIHDLMETYAGDTPPYDDEGRESQESRGRAAAETLLGLLPAEQGWRLRGLWDEFEAPTTPGARVAKPWTDCSPCC